MRDSQIGHHQHRSNIGVVISQRTESNVVAINGDFLKDALVQMITVNHFDVEVPSHFRARQFVGQMEFPLKHRDAGTVAKPILGHLRADGRCTNNDNFRMFWEIRDFMAKGDERWIESVQTNDSNGQSVTNFQHTLFVWNKTTLAISLDAYDVWKSVDKVILDVFEWTTHDVLSRLTNVKFNDVGVLPKRNDLLNIRGPQASVKSLDGTVQWIDDVVDLRPFKQMSLVEFINIGSGSKAANTRQFVLPL